jgi:periplasmic divalent cation tolerance protein
VSEHVVAFSTARAEDSARIAHELVEHRLAACVNVVAGVQSTYRWEGKVETEAEHLLVIKTRRDRLPALKAAFVALHPYEVPELIILPIEDGLPSYLAWLSASVVPSPT